MKLGQLFTQIFAFLFIKVTFGIRNDGDTCTQFISQEDILRSFDYPIDINNTINENTDLTYARTNKNGEITFLQIADQQSISSSISCLYYLTEIRVIRTKSFDLKQFPQYLQSLYLSHVDMSSHSNDLHRFHYLEYLHITHTNLQFVPWINTLHRLKYLILDHNDLHFLSATTIRLKELIKIDVTDNPHLKSLDMLNNHPKLQQIIASSCSITHLPKNLPQLVELQLKNNLISSLDNLETLGQETVIPKFFIFENNQIDKLNRLMQVKNLHTVNVRNNNLQTIPLKLLCGRKELKHILISHNPAANYRGYKDDIQILKRCLPNTEID